MDGAKSIAGLISLQSKPDSNQPPFGQITHPESGAVRDLYDCLAVPLTPAGPVVRLLVATHPAGDRKPAIGVVRKEIVYELFYTTLPPHAFTASDVLQMYLHRGSFETVHAARRSRAGPGPLGFSYTLRPGLLADHLAVDLESPFRIWAPTLSHCYAFDGIFPSSIG